MHWSVLSILTRELRAPAITTRIPQSFLRVQWIHPVSTTLRAGGTDLASSIPSDKRKKLSLDDVSVLEQPNINDPKRQTPRGTGVALETSPGWNPLHYRLSNEVDTRSIPAIEWTINHGAAPKNSVAILIVTVWVSAVGEIDHFHVENQQPGGDWVAEALSGFQTTVMEPATLAGVPVASTMTVEISLDNTNNEPGTN